MITIKKEEKKGRKSAPALGRKEKCEASTADGQRERLTVTLVAASGKEMTASGASGRYANVKTLKHK